MDYGKMKVIDLRAELQARGLDTKGVKAALIDRLKEALDLEEEQAASGSNVIVPKPVPEAPGEEVLDPKITPDTPRRRRSSRSRTKSPEPIAKKVALDPAPLTVVSEEPEEIAQVEEVKEIPESVLSTEQPQTFETKPPSEQEFDEKILDEMDVDDHPTTEPMDEDALLAEPTVSETGEPEVKVDTSDNVKSEAVPHESADSQTDDKEKTSTDDERRGKKRRAESPTPKGDSPKKRQRLPPPNIDDFVNDEDEPDLDENLIQLSWFDSDLNLKINRESFCSALSLSETGLALVWAGARANYGVINNGKYFFEVQLVAFNTKINYPNERRLHEIRCGWSTVSSSLQLGENPLSFGLDSSGKKCNNSEFTEYGSRLNVEDVVGVHLEINDDKGIIQYTINGKDQGIAFEFDKNTLNGEALFPHISTKNIEYKVNFGQQEASLWSSRRDAYKEKELKRRRAELERKKKDLEKQLEEKSKKTEEAEIKKTEEAEIKKTEEAEIKEAEDAESKKSEDAESKKSEEAESKKPEDAEQLKSEDAEEPKSEVSEKPAEEMESDTIETAEKSTEEAEKTTVEAEESKPEPSKIEEAQQTIEKEEAEPSLPDDITEAEVDQDTPLADCLPGFQFIAKIAIADLTKGPRRPNARTDCEVIMMIGLPGAGKSHWALQRAKENPEKHYTLLGTKYLLERMKIQGEARKPGAGPGRWEKLIELCNRGLSTLNEIACQRRRNYILDRPHVYISDQRRKMRVYGDFKRIAVIVVPTEEEYKRRFKERLNTEGKDISEAAVDEMRANLTLPELEYQWFNEILYTDLEKEAAQAEVSKENERGKRALLSQRNRNDFGRGGGNREYNNRNDQRSRWGAGRNDRSDFRRNDRWMPPQSGNRGGPQQMGSGYRRDYDYNSGGRGRNWNQPDNWNSNRSRGGYGGAPPPRPGRKPQERDFRSNDRRDNRQRDFRSQGGNKRQDNRKFGNKSDWNSQGTGGGQWSNNSNWNNYGGNQGWTGGQQWNNQPQQYGGSSNDNSNNDTSQQWMAYYQQQQQGQQGWYSSDQNYGGAFSSATYDNNQTKQ